jgi:hypothetical protein
MCLFRQKVDKTLLKAFYNSLKFLFLLVFQSTFSIFVLFSFLLLFVPFCFGTSSSKFTNRMYFYLIYVFLLLSTYYYCCLCILIVRPCILIVVYVYLLLSMYSYTRLL